LYCFRKPFINMTLKLLSDYCWFHNPFYHI
jgi:hypothetical protein